MAQFTPEEILHQLDTCATEYQFPMLDNGYIYPADVRLHAYADTDHWALIIEHLGYSVREGDHEGIVNCVHYYGNCLRRRPGIAAEDFLTVTADGPDDFTFQEEVNWHLRHPQGSIYIRDELVRYDVTKLALEKLNITQAEEKPSGADLLRSLLPEYRHLLLANEKELLFQLTSVPPILLQLDEWYHPDLAAEELPSICETFQQIAAVLATADRSNYRPTETANSHWSNWPNGGTL